MEWLRRVSTRHETIFGALFQQLYLSIYQAHESTSESDSQIECYFQLDSDDWK